MTTSTTNFTLSARSAATQLFLLFQLLSLASGTTYAAAPAVPPVLTQNAIISAKSFNSAMLAVTHAGSRLVAVGERGIILLSDDAGKSWRQAPSPVQVSLVAVQFITPQSGWAVGHLGVILHTNDAGQSWQKQFDGIQAANAMLAQAQTPEYTQEQKNAARQMVDDGPDKPFLNVFFQNPTTGYVIGAYNLMFKTTDAGKTWLPWQNHVSNPKSFHLYGIGANNGADSTSAASVIYLAGEQGILFRSVDNGTTFDSIASPYKGSYFGLITAKTGEIVVYGLRGSAFWSGDQGNHWEKIDTQVHVSMAAGLELSDGTLALLSQSGEVMLSHDKGRTFQHPATYEAVPSAALAQLDNTPDETTFVVAGLRGVKRVVLSTHAKE